MASLTFIIEPDEVLGLSALVGLDKAADGGDPGTGTDADAVSKAKALRPSVLAWPGRVGILASRRYRWCGMIAFVAAARR